MGQLRAIFFAMLLRERRVNPSRNRCKLVERSLFAIIDLLQGAESILLQFIGVVGG